MLKGGNGLLKITGKMKNNDFTVFTCMVKGVLLAGEVIRQDKTREFHGEAKMRFNKLMFECQNFEKQLHKGLGKDMAVMEDDMNSEIFQMVWNIFNLEDEERTAYLAHVAEFVTTTE